MHALACTCARVCRRVCSAAGHGGGARHVSGHRPCSRPLQCAGRPRALNQSRPHARARPRAHQPHAAPRPPRSNDRALLERCLAASSPRVIANTVARIVPRDAALFLRAAVDRLLARPGRAGQLAPWLRALLHHHTGYLMAAPGAQVRGRDARVCERWWREGVDRCVLVA